MIARNLTSAAFGLAFALIGVLPAFAQFPPREDDHFWRRRVVYQIDLEEKLNYPLKQAENLRIYDYAKGYPNKRGIVFALFKAYKLGEVLGYKPDSLSAPYPYEVFLEDLLTHAEALKSDLAAPAAGGGEGGGGDDFGGFEDFGDFGDFGDDLFGDEAAGGETAPAGDGDAPAAGSEDVLGGGGLDLKEGVSLDDIIRDRLNYKIEVIEERIFDKNKSSMYYDIQFIRFFYVDESQPAKQKAMVAIKYDQQAMDVLDLTQWKNRHNDAEYRTIREIMDLRLHNHFFINVSGENMVSLNMAEDRRLRQVEFEHNLWEL